MRYPPSHHDHQYHQFHVDVALSRNNKHLSPFACDEHDNHGLRTTTRRRRGPSPYMGLVVVYAFLCQIAATIHTTSTPSNDRSIVMAMRWISLPPTWRRRSRNQGRGLALAQAQQQSGLGQSQPERDDEYADAYAVTGSRTNDKSLIQHYVEARCGRSGLGTLTFPDDDGNDIDEASGRRTTPAALWLYEGALYDPMNGQRVAGIQGIELVRVVPCPSVPGEAQTRREGAAETSTVTIPSPASTATPATSSTVTFQSRKLFYYRDPSNPHQVLSTIRLSPTRPIRRVPLNQAVTAYETFATITEPSQQHSRHDGSSNFNDDRIDPCKEWQIQTIWSNNRRGRPRNHHLQMSAADRKDASSSSSSSSSVVQCWSTIQPHFRSITNRPINMLAGVTTTNRSSWQLGSSTNLMEFTTFLRSSQQPPRVMTPSTTTTTSSPPRLSWVQFGSSTGNSNSINPKFGARETYQYTWSPDSIQQDVQVAAGQSAQPRRHAWPWARAWKRSSSSRPPPPRSSTQSTATSSSSPVPEVRYTRYGEGPVWYGPGRWTMMELTGRRLLDPSQLPPLLWELATRNVIPNNFWDFGTMYNDTTTTSSSLRQVNSLGDQLTYFSVTEPQHGGRHPTSLECGECRTDSSHHHRCRRRQWGRAAQSIAQRLWDATSVHMGSTTTTTTTSTTFPP